MRPCEQLESRVLFSSGGVDHSFGVNGEVAATANYSPYGIVVETGGKFIVCGSAGSTSTDTQGFLLEYGPNGQLEQNFGSDGKVSMDFGGEPANIVSVTSEKNGDILAIATDSTDGSFVARFTPEGKLDTTFGKSGKLIMPAQAAAEQVKLAGNGQIVVSASYDLAPNTIEPLGFRPLEPMFLRYGANGRPDVSFGEAGVELTNFGEGYFVSDFRILGNNKIDAVVVQNPGVALSGPRSAMLVRYDANGSLDTSFDKTGKMSIPDGNTWQFEKNGSILSSTGSGLPTIAHDSSSGAPDANFGAGGQTTIIFGGTLPYTSPTLFTNFETVVEPNGKLLVAGTGSPPSSGSFAVFARLNANGTVDMTFGNHGTLANDFAENDAVATVVVDGRRLLVLDQLGNIFAYGL
jgi:uncharacterized delta-60 repeat protein